MAFDSCHSQVYFSMANPKPKNQRSAKVVHVQKVVLFAVPGLARWHLLVGIRKHQRKHGNKDQQRPRHQVVLAVLVHARRGRLLDLFINTPSTRSEEIPYKLI